MIEIDPKITQIPGFDQDCLWFLYKMTQVKMSYQNTHPKLATLEKWTGWEKKKVLRVAEKLGKMGVLKIEKRWKKGGGQSSNEYTITTKHIFYKTNAEGASLTDSEAEKDHESQNGTLAREHESQKRHGDESQNGTHNIKYSNSLKPTTCQEAREEFLDFELDDQRRIFAKTTLGLTDEEIEITLLDFKDEPKYRQNPPTNPAKTFMNWLRNVGLDKLAQNHRKQAIEKSAKLADDRVEEYHQKKQENIAKVGSGTKARGNEVKVIDPYDFESYDDYQAAVDEASERNEPVKILEPSSTRYRIWGVSPPRHGSVVKSPDYSSGYSERELETKKNQIMQEYAQ